MPRKGFRIKSSIFLEQFARLESRSAAPLIPTRFFVSLSVSYLLSRRGPSHSKSVYEALFLVRSIQICCKFSSLYIYVYVCVFMPIYVNIYVCIYMYVCVYIYVCTYMYVRVYICIYIHTYISYTHTYLYIHPIYCSSIHDHRQTNCPEESHHIHVKQLQFGRDEVEVNVLRHRPHLPI